MKIAILGDIHGNLEALNAVLEETKRLGVTHYACIGDVVGYNANPKECLDIIRNMDMLGIVKGNHDAYTSSNEDLSSFNAQAAQAVEWTKRQLSADDMEWLRNLPMKQHCYVQKYHTRFSLVHATLDNPDKWGYIFDRFTAESSMQYQWTPLCFFGHTHTPLAFDKSDLTIGGTYEEIKIMPNHKYLINVGSVGQPRDRDPRAGFVTLDLVNRVVKLHRVQYDIEACQKKIISAGLPIRLSERLAVGR